MHETRRSARCSRRSTLCALLLLTWTSSVSCSSTSGPPPGRSCPQPSDVEARDYVSLGDRPATQWVGRIVAYCWPEDLREVRRDG